MTSVTLYLNVENMPKSIIQTTTGAALQIRTMFTCIAVVAAEYLSQSLHHEKPHLFIRLCNLPSYTQTHQTITATMGASFIVSLSGVTIRISQKCLS